MWLSNETCPEATLQADLVASIVECIRQNSTDGRGNNLATLPPVIVVKYNQRGREEV
jgi:hypothetical protein